MVKDIDRYGYARLWVSTVAEALYMTVMKHGDENLSSHQQYIHNTKDLCMVPKQPRGYYPVMVGDTKQGNPELWRGNERLCNFKTFNREDRAKYENGKVWWRPGKGDWELYDIANTADHVLVPVGWLRRHNLPPGFLCVVKAQHA